MVKFLSIIFFSWISSIFGGFFKSSRFFCVTFYHNSIYHKSVSLYNLYCYMFLHFHVNISELHICALLSYIHKFT